MPLPDVEVGKMVSEHAKKGKTLRVALQDLAKE
jgi:hypothetical protein